MAATGAADNANCFDYTCRLSKVTPFSDHARLLNVDGIIVLTNF
jgi:hypothetical protein